MALNKKLLNDAIQLSNVIGVSGREQEVAKLIKVLTKDIKGLKYEFDNLGSLAIIKEGTNKKAPLISISTHMDEIGFMITKIEENGFLKITPLGGWWGHVLLGQILNITTTKGKIIPAVVGSTPPHILSPVQQKTVLKIKDLFLDLGVSSKAEVEKLGIKVGSIAAPNTSAFQMANPNLIVGKGLDNRISVAAGIDMLRKLEKVEHESTVMLICTTQEEVGLRGARTSSWKWTPDLGIALDTTIANDTPGIEARDTKIGTGVALSLFDSSVIANEKLFDFVEKTAKSNDIKYTFDSLTGGGTDSGVIHLTKDGVLNMTLSIPTRYMHSHNTIASIEDAEAASDLLVEIVKTFDKRKLSSLKFK